MEVSLDSAQLFPALRLRFQREDAPKGFYPKDRLHDRVFSPYGKMTRGQILIMSRLGMFASRVRKSLLPNTLEARQFFCQKQWRNDAYAFDGGPEEVSEVTLVAGK